MPHEPVVAVGLLSERDLRTLGEGFRRYARVVDDDAFDDLLAKLDRIAAVPPVRGR